MRRFAASYNKKQCKGGGVVYGSLNLLPQCHIFIYIYIYIYTKKKSRMHKRKTHSKTQSNKEKKETRTEKNREQHQAKKRKREEHTKTWKKFQQSVCTWDFHSPLFFKSLSPSFSKLNFCLVKRIGSGFMRSS